MSIFRNFIETQQINRIDRLLRGNIPNINTVGILTAENPQGELLPSWENKELNRLLEKDLRIKNYGYSKVKGKVEDNIEQPFLIPNITKEDIIALGKKYNQKSLIWGKKELNDQDALCFNFEWIEGDETTKTRSISADDKNIKKGNQFSIPFDEFFIPFFDDETSKLDKELTFEAQELPTSVREQIEEIKIWQDQLNELDKTDQHYWVRRGAIEKRLEEIRKLV